MAKRKSHLMKRTKGKNAPIVFIYPGVTDEEMEEVKFLIKLGWNYKYSNNRKEDNEEDKKQKKENVVDEKFEIRYEEITKKNMLDYLTNIKKVDEKEIEKFALESCKSIKTGEYVYTNDGKLKYNHLAAKEYFYKTYFKDRYEKMKKDKDDKKDERDKAAAEKREEKEKRKKFNDNLIALAEKALAEKAIADEEKANEAKLETENKEK